MKIPKKFKMMNDEIKIIIDSKLIDNQDYSGLADYRNNIIYMADKTKHNIPDSHIDKIFFHELLHHAFNQLNEDKLRKNEKLIDNLAGILSQAFNTMEY